jgi:hypothetical protein
MPMIKRKWSNRQWAQHARLAYGGYRLKGRGALVLDVLPLVSPATGQPRPAAELYLSQAEIAEQDWLFLPPLESIYRQIDRYNPDTQIVVIGRGLKAEFVVQVMESDDPTWSPRAVYEELARDPRPPGER